MLTKFVREELTALAPTNAHLGAAVAYVAGAFAELLIWWLETRNGLDPSELEALFQRLTAPIIDELRGAAPRSSRKAD